MINKIKQFIFFRKNNEINKIFTHLTSVEKIKLFELSKRVEGEVFVEIGSYLGASSCFISLAIKNDDRKKLYCIDTWQNDAMSEGKRDTYQQFMENTKAFADKIVPIRNNSIYSASDFTNKVDFIFFDGDHSYEGIKGDVDAWWPLLKSGSIVVFHDFGWAEGIKKVVKEMVSPYVINVGYLPNMYWAEVK